MLVIQQARGTTAQHANYVGPEGQITVDTDKKTLVVQDGVMPGGNPLATIHDLPTFTIGTVNTVDPSAQATVTINKETNTHYINFNIPKGETGEQGIAASIEVIGTETTPSDTLAEVTNSGTSSDVKLNFKIPKGANGIPLDKVVYTTEEVYIGDYVDGKPIYRKMWFNIPHGTNGAFTTPIDISTLAVDLPINIHFSRSYDDRRTVRFDTDRVFIRYTNNQLEGAIATGVTSVAAGIYEYILFEYTKTTD